MLKSIAQKLGIQENTHVIAKANELSRLLQNKIMGGSVIHINDCTKNVICLDLACRLQEIVFDYEMVHEVSGIKKNSYMNSFRLVETLLDLTLPLTVNELCVKLGLTAVADKADMLLVKYKECHTIRDDMTHPQYVSMAVFQACRLEKVKISRNKIIPFSRLKSAQWAILEESWSKWADTVASLLVKDSAKTAGPQGIKEKCQEAESLLQTNTAVDKDTELIFEDYDTWKERILAQADKDLERKIASPKY